jgi:hypothetical protein
MALEDEFNVEIPDKDAEEIFTPRQAVEKVCSAYVDLCKQECSLRAHSLAIKIKSTYVSCSWQLS